MMGASELYAGSAGMSAGGGLGGAYGSYSAGRQARKIGQFNRQIAQSDAESVRQATRYNQQRMEKEGRRLRGTMLARAAASGARLDVGAPIAAEAALAGELDFDMMVAGIEGENRARQISNQGEMANYTGKIQQRNEYAQGISRLGKTGGTLLKDWGEYKRDFGTEDNG